jgi:nucleotide-binding universal stress UspA family protein
MFSTIVVGTNWSETADAAFAKAVELARADGATLHVVSATEPAPAPVSGGSEWTARPDFHADEVLRDALERHGGQELEVEQHVQRADPAEAILAVAEGKGAELIVVGNKGMQRRVLGSIPNTVSHRAPCDVLIVQTGGRAPATFDVIVVGTDGSETADVALRRAVDMARMTGARLHVLSAYEPSPARVGGRQPVAEAAEWSIKPDFKVESVLERATGVARGSDVEIEVHAPRGDPADALVRVATEQSAGLIVLGSRGMRGARRMLGSVPNKVSHHAPCDVLIVQTS